VFIEGQLWRRVRRGFGSRRTCAYDPGTGRADRLTLRTHGGSRAFANRSAGLITGPGRPALLVSLFFPREEPAPGASGRLIDWRELWQPVALPVRQCLQRCDGRMKRFAEDP
jgi:hypothetical protein